MLALERWIWGFGRMGLEWIEGSVEGFVIAVFLVGCTEDFSAVGWLVEFVAVAFVVED